MKKQRINYKNERVVLSDILPYEVPPFFNNQQFYYFLIENKIQLEGDKLCFSKASNPKITLIIRLIFGLKDIKHIHMDNPKYNYINIKTKSRDHLITIPYKYRVQHRNKYRQLSVIHPLNQLELVSFYQKYAYSIIYNCNRGNFSIRKPHKLATIKYFKDVTNKRKTKGTSDIEIIETTDQEYTSLKTFFSYEKYSNVYKFYESFDFQKAEKKFDSLLKFDITRCFDSIYTHTLPWALTNKLIVKDNIKLFNNSFGGKFERIMQKMNFNETNGIVIGPEFSRIFAELILQDIDNSIELELQIKYKLKNKIDYSVSRYVDDYFLFYNDEEIKDKVYNAFIPKLENYNFFLNDSKTITYNKPIITNITIAKEKIRELISNISFLNFQEVDTNINYYRFFTAKDTITNYKLIIQQTGITYGDIQNYFLAAIFTKVVTQIKKIQKQQRNLLVLEIALNKSSHDEEKEELRQKISEFELLLQKDIKRIINNITNIIELVLFIYSVLPSISYSIKISNIFFRIIDFVKNQESTQKKYINKPINTIGSFSSEVTKYIGVTFDKRHQIFKQIYDGILIVFNKKNNKELGQDGRWYLLSVVSELGKHYKLTENQVAISTGIGIEHWDYFTIMSVLGYIKDDKDYFNLRKRIVQRTLNIFKSYDSRNAEHVMLSIDILNSPFFYLYINNQNEFKVKIMQSIGLYANSTPRVDIESDIEEIKKFRNNYFYRWNNRNLAVDLNTKKGHFVY